MGQYYRPVVVGNYGRLRWLKCYDYGNGAKLMEHSYIGNKFVNAVASQIVDCARKIAWIGDYSNEFCGDKYEKKIKEITYHRRFEQVWGERDEKYCINPDPIEFDIDTANGWYLVNRTKKQYIDLGEYVEANKWSEKYPDGDFYWCVHPLPLLTACGNGRGGGDYNSDMPCYDSVGIWAYDEIELTRDKNRIPESYEKVMFTFREVFA